MIPVIALVGRPNVGKSTLFNGLTRRRNALVADISGMTRDRQYGTGRLGDYAYVVIDTGGLTDTDDAIDQQVNQQVQRAVEEADVVVFVVDVRAGLTSRDIEIAHQLRRLNKPIQIAVNKSEGQTNHVAGAEFHSLGLGKPLAIAAVQRKGLATLMDTIAAQLPAEKIDQATPDGDDSDIRIAVVGRPNVGKSTLINRLLGEPRLLAMDHPGTTRNRVDVTLEEDGQRYILVDTAGIRRRGKVHDTVEKFSVVQSLQAIETAHVVFLLLDARQGLVDQDITILRTVIDAGRGLVIVVNKWDRLSEEKRRQIKHQIKDRLEFARFAQFHYISALHGSDIVELLPMARGIFHACSRDMSTPQLTRLLQDAVAHYPPPVVGGYRSKLRYAHQGGKFPPRIIIHGNRTKQVPMAYHRYLVGLFMRHLKLRGTPLVLDYQDSHNPYQKKK